MSHQRVLESSYQQWSKSHIHVKYNLAASGVASYQLQDLPFSLNDIELTGNSYYGYEPLQRALAEKYGVEAGLVFQTIGTSMANHIAIATLVDPGDEILVEHPTYELILSTALYLGARIRRFHRRPEDGFAIDPGEIERAITPETRLIVLTNLHNPSSAFTNEETLLKIGAIARTVGAKVLVDEVYLDAAFHLSPRSAVHLGKEFVVTNSLTKVYGLSGLRCGWVLADPDLIRKMWHLIDLFYVLPPHAAERLSVIALQNLNTIAARSRSIIETNRRVLKIFLAARPRIRAIDPGFGTVVFCRIESGSIDALSHLLESKYETVIAPGRFFEMPEYFRIGLGSLPESFAYGLERLGKAVDELEKL